MIERNFCTTFIRYIFNVEKDLKKSQKWGLVTNKHHDQDFLQWSFTGYCEVVEILNVGQIQQIKTF